MNTVFPNFQIIRIPQTASTNTYLLELTNEKKLAEGSLVVTDNQTLGRGQSGNSWESEPGANLTFSVILYPATVMASDQFIVSKAISLALFDFISEMVPDGVSIKWPNDLYVGDKKIAGILLENFIEGAYLTKTIAGIGMNINQERFFSDAPNPVSLRQLTGKTYPLENCLKILHARIAACYRMITEDAEKINSNYLRHLYRFGKLSRFCADGLFFDATITGVNRYGMLEMTDANGECRAFGFKEVRFERGDEIL